MTEEKSPFWATPPYILLTDILQLDKVQPWNVDVGKLVAGFLTEMRRLGDIDFRISGNALYSASVIFTKKTRELVELGLLSLEEDDDDDIEIPLIRPPFRLTNQRVTLEELLVAMDHVLSKGIRQRPSPKKRKYYVKADPLQFAMDVDQANVEETIAEVYDDLKRLVKVNEAVRFREILVSSTRREIVRIFVSLLFLYARSFIDIWMDEEEGIWLKLLEPPRPMKKREKQADSVEPKIER